MLGEISDRSVKCVGVHVTIWTDAMLEDLYFVLHLLFSHAQVLKRSHTQLSGERHGFFPNDNRCVKYQSVYLFRTIVLPLVISTLLSTALFSYLLLFTVQLDQLITIPAVIVNINNTKAHDASLPFTIKAIIVIAPTCNLN